MKNTGKMFSMSENFSITVDNKTSIVLLGFKNSTENEISLESFKFDKDDLKEVFTLAMDMPRSGKVIAGYEAIDVNGIWQIEIKRFLDENIWMNFELIETKTEKLEPNASSISMPSLSKKAGMTTMVTTDTLWYALHRILQEKKK